MQKNLKDYRPRVELLIHHRGKVAVTVNRDGNQIWHGLPGGGLDEGETPEAGAAREALEEIGLKVRNIRYSGEMSVKEGYKSNHADRVARYKGSYTLLFEADYDGEDNSILNKDGDQTKFKWMTPREAYSLIEPHIRKNGGSGNHQPTVLKRYL